MCAPCSELPCNTIIMVSCFEITRNKMFGIKLCSEADFSCFNYRKSFVNFPRGGRCVPLPPASIHFLAFLSLMMHLTVLRKFFVPLIVYLHLHVFPLLSALNSFSCLSIAYDVFNHALENVLYL